MNRRKLLDVGGTFIKCSDGRSVPIDSNGSREDICSAFREAVGPCDPSDSVSIAIPGPFDYKEGVFLMKHKFAAVYGERFRDVAGIPEETPVKFIHDANCMLLGELTCGAGKDYKNVALVTLGTGLGFTMAVDGQILLSPGGSPAVSAYNQPYRDGVLEDYVSKRGIHRTYDTLGGVPAASVKEIAERAAAGDPVALEAFRSTGACLAEALAPVLREYGIECLLFGGQISKAFPYIRAGFGDAFDFLKKVAPISDFEHATFNGLNAVLNTI